MPQTREIWHARRGRGEDWSKARRLIAGAWIGWGEGYPKIRQGTGASLIPVTVFGDSVRDLALIVIQGSEATVEWLRVAHFPIYADVAPDTADSLFLAWVGPSLRHGEPQAVQVAASGDGGVTWTIPELLGPSDGTRGRSVVVTYGAGEKPLRVFWLSDDRQSIVWRARTGAGHWEPSRELHLGGRLTRPHAQVDSCGRTHVIVEQYSKRGPRILHFLWDGEAPSRIALPTSAQRSMEADLTRSREGHMALIWNAILAWPIDRHHYPVRPYYSLLSYECA